MLHINHVTFRIGGRTLLESASTHIPAGHRVGLVGSNGTGKTTLLRLIIGTDEVDEGTIGVRSHSRVGMVAQEAPGGEQTPLDAVLAADTVRADLLAEASTAEDPMKISEIHTRLVDIDAHAAPSRAASILAGLGFDEPSQLRPLQNFSGGWRMRVALAAVLFSEPDLLLLDEPTNHLDLEASLWLENYLRSYPHTMLMVSHDRNLLSHAVDHILHLEDLKLEMYTGGYDAFERVRSARLLQNQALQKKQELARNRMQSFVDRFRAKATKAKQAQSRIKALERLSPPISPTRERHIAFRFPKPPRSPSPLVRLEETSVGYTPSKPILKNLYLSIFAEDRIALLGSNGNGKTTLARLISGTLEPQEGQLFKSSKVRVGYFAQDQLEQLNPDFTALEQMRAVMADDSQTSVRSWLGRYGFSAEKVDVPVGGLSGGEKTRLALALMTHSRPNLLILDEPTNHLDMASREALTTALNEYRGAIILISHDHHLIETTADQLWIVRDGTATAFSGDLEAYRSLLLEDKRSSHAAGVQNENSLEKKDRKANRRDKAEARARIAPLKRKAIEAQILLDDLTKEKAEIDSELSNPALYNGPRERIKNLSKRQKELEEAIAVAEEAWMDAESALEDHLALEKAD
jgi:ATP-binding cassette subfamily F protein 3